MRPIKIDIDPIDVDPDGIAENQTLGEAGDLTLNGALCDLGTAGQFDIEDAGYSSGCGGVQIAIDSAGDISGVTFTVTGLDQDGKSVTEDITGVTTAAVESTNYYSQITQIAADGAVGSNVFVGPVDEVATSTIPVSYLGQYQATAAVDITGTIDFTVRETFDDIQTSVNAVQDAQWFNISALASKTADTIGEAARGATALSLIVNSYSSGAEAQLFISQPEC